VSDAVRPTKQEQEPAATEVTEVAPGVLRMQLPVMLPGLGHVNCYALSDDQGVAIVDPGLPGPDSAQALTARLADAGYEPRHVHTVVITHSHIDHFGGANVFARAGARVVTHRAFQNWWDPSPDVELDPHEPGAEPAEPVASTNGHDRHHRPHDAGAAAVELTSPWSGERLRTPMEEEKIRAYQASDPDFFRAPDPTKRLADADVITLAGREWVAVFTPGHTPDHLCLLDPANGVLLSGDHVLPTITPHISGIGAGSDPLARFFVSLERMHDLPPVRTVLPAHGHPFTDLDGRVDAIRLHHEERLAVLREAMARLGPASVVDLSHELFKPRSWGGMAESETFAHLEHLRLAGDATRTEEAGLLIYAPA
jgi:glyoxylase-like metal-dependent hydrolase (beta-lactamase superfamily II)